MNQSIPDDMGNLPMLELFRVEAEKQTAILTSGLLELERGPAAPQQLEMLMRAAHSFKGAARIVNLADRVRVAHAMEDCFALAQQGKLELRQREIDLLFRGIDLLGQISKHTEASISRWDTDHAEELRQFLDSLASFIPARETPAPALGRASRSLSALASDDQTQDCHPSPQPRTRHPGSLLAGQSPRAGTKTRNGWCGSPPRISIGCWAWQASRWSNPAGCARSPTRSSASNATRPSCRISWMTCASG